MSLTPINQEQIQGTCQVVLAYLDDEANSTPNNMLEGIVSGKSLLRGILAGQLVVCQNQPDAPQIREKAPEVSADVEVEVDVDDEAA